MNVLSHSSTIFRIAAVVNVIAAISALLAMPLHLQIFYGRSSTDVLVQFYHYNFWAVVLMMGYGYAAIARHPLQHRPLMLIGGVGKLIAAISWLLLYIINEATIMVWGGILYDGLFGLLFFLIYRRTASPE